MVILDEDTDIGGGIGVGVRETGIRGEGVDRWAVRAKIRGISLSKPGKSGG